MIAPPDFTTPVRGPSYSVSIRVVTMVIALVVVYGTLRWLGVTATEGWTSQGVMVFIATLFGTIGASVLMLRSITEIDADGIRQSGFVNRRVAWGQIANARVARWGATRLIVRRDGGPFFLVFHGGTPELRAAFERVAQASRT